MDQFSVVSPRKLNLQGFENKNTLSKTELETLISKGQVEVYTEESMKKFIDEAGDKIEKSEDSQKDIVKKAIESELSTLKKHRVEGKILYLRPKKLDTIEKGEEIIQLQPNDIIKGQISDAFSYGSLSKVEFPKKGSEIKEQIQKKITAISSEKEDLKTKMATLVEKLPLKPSMPCSDYTYSGMKDKVGEIFCYPYNYCYYDDRKPDNTYDNLTTQKETVVGPASVEEAKMYDMYNTLAQQYVRRAVDIEYLTLFMNNLDDKKSYSLTVPQLVDLGV